MIRCENTCVVLCAGYYVFKMVLGHVCSTKCRLLCVLDG
ncbi:hypothetical protein F383_28806 [Gossypium arboreum]|uniref:Uncharacterized protein n=1 Tax=Gossypium arboreum TaxID=29729 RepID=A0A0B0PCW5_GOSAR|nr:hypothetical protein F383_28806 [Gossypium arboreum]